MLSFELSAIDFILGIAVIVLLILYMKELSTKHTIKERFRLKERAEIFSRLKTKGKMKSSTRPLTNSLKCPHHFGYLRKLAKDTPLPDECLGCYKIVECLGSEK